MSTKDIVRQAYVELAADTLDAYGRKLEALARGRTIQGLEEFKSIYNDKIAKLREKGKIGPKGWAKLEEAMPVEARTYFRQFAGGFDMTTDEGFLAFLGAVQDAGKGLDAQAREGILARFATATAQVFNQPDEDEDEDEDF